MQPIIHTELYAQDHEKLAAWYAAMFGWDSSAMPGMDYSSGWWNDTNGSGWGFGGARYGLKPGDIVPYIASSDVDADARRIGANGATVDEIVDLPGVGRIAHFRDPEGNHLALIQPEMPDAPSAAG